MWRKNVRIPLQMPVQVMKPEMGVIYYHKIRLVQFLSIHCGDPFLWEHFTRIYKSTYRPKSVTNV